MRKFAVVIASAVTLASCAGFHAENGVSAMGQSIAGFTGALIGVPMPPSVQPAVMPTYDLVPPSPIQVPPAQTVFPPVRSFASPFIH